MKSRTIYNLDNKMENSENTKTAMSANSKEWP